MRYGAAGVRRMVQVLSEAGAHHALLVCGGAYERSGADRLLEPLTDMARIRRWSDFTPNPDLDDLARGLAIMRDTRPDVVIGVGGGSSMDMAKLLCAFADVDPPELRRTVCSGTAITARAPLLFLIPTTSGSGSEATHFAVLYVDGTKLSIAGPALRPDLAALVPKLAATATAAQRAASGLDAMAHALESLWAVRATAESRSYALRALRLLRRRLEGFVLAPTPTSIRAMAVGSHLAGRAIDISTTTAAHALSYAMTARYGVAHGHAVALTLGAVTEVHACAAPAALRPSVSAADHAAAMGVVLDALGAVDGASARRQLDALVARLGLVVRLRDVGVSTPGEARALAAAVDQQRLANDPVRWEADTVSRLMESLW